MFRTLVKTDALEVENRVLRVCYFEQRTGRGLRRYSAEIVIGSGDHVILDDDSIMMLETRATRVAPATFHSRRLVRATAA